VPLARGPLGNKRTIPLRPGAISFQRLLGDDAIVVRMGADPEPQYAIRDIDRQGTIVSAYARRMEAPNALEMQRRVAGVRLEELKLLVRKNAHGLWQGLVASPVARCCVVIQSFRERPAR